MAADDLQGKMQVFLAAGVVAFDTELLVADRATGGNRRIVYPWRRVLQHFEDGSAPVGPKNVAGNRGELLDDRTRVLHRHKLPAIASAEGPEIDNLIAVGIDDFERLAVLHACGFSGAGGNGGEGCSVSHEVLHLEAREQPPYSRAGS